MPLYEMANGMPVVAEERLSRAHYEQLTAQLIEDRLTGPGRLPVSPGFRHALDKGFGGLCVRRLRMVVRTSPDAKKRQAAARILHDVKLHQHRK